MYNSQFLFIFNIIHKFLTYLRDNILSSFFVDLLSTIISIVGLLIAIGGYPLAPDAGCEIEAAERMGGMVNERR